jgi:1-acyl-sn-glycerol-3-phosphate acyltransferase
MGSSTPRRLVSQEGSRSILGDAVARAFLLASALFHAGVLAGIAVILPYGERLRMLSWGVAGCAMGFLLGGANGHPIRALGRIPLGLTGLAIVLWVASFSDGSEIPVLPCLFFGVAIGAVSVPLRAAYQQSLPEHARVHGIALGSALTAILGAGLVVGLLALEGMPARFAMLALLAAAGAVVAWITLFVPTLEMLAEWLMTPMYRVRAEGPGAGCIPGRGPLLIVANHAAWGDPFWIAKIVPRHVRPMMTSRFFDLRVVRWLMVHVVRAIRVQHELIRRETPELDEAIAVLRSGECLAIFPEGSMRRDEEHPLRPFGQGVWHILSAVPQTPVVACWIEGGWGSYTSYFQGPPTKNKRIDWGRIIRIGVAEAEILPAEVLADRQRTRDYLRQRCLECRRFLRLEVSFTAEAAENAEKDKRGN